ncbi:MalY/PatB family protein [Companilactobacillus kedongensis]|uniref:MalY/PatB family protein n=1 Tax=Companilactobacillus kedongensis TaxID=2486004 RepID=UPI000F79405D|nr:MalY/PatB family protein [Companilactobacillus kedongensis]
MAYDFDKLNDRRKTNSIKWDVEENELPMWVADMDFQTVPEVLEAMHADVDRGIFGYQYVPDEYYQAIINWYKTEYNFEPKMEWLTFSTGVVPSIASIIRHLTDVGDNILLQEPNYNSFYHTITDNGRHILNSELDYSDGKYAVNWQDLEDKLSEVETTAMIICNPHNPTGYIWSAEELTKIGSLAKKHHVMIISDEIHGDLTMPGFSYVPFASLDKEITDNSISLVSPSKTFNLAVLHAATLIVPNAALLTRVERGLSIDGISSPGALAINGSIAAYKYGHEWLKELREYISNNRQILRNFVKANIPEITVLDGEATYLAWLDCSKVTDNSEEFAQFVRDQTGLYVADGEKYKGNGNQFLRINLATTKSRVEDGLKRLKAGTKAYLNK